MNTKSISKAAAAAALVGFLAVASCYQSRNDQAPGGRQVGPKTAKSSLASPPSSSVARAAEQISESMPQAEKVFAEVLSIIREQYVDGKLSEDSLWTGAVIGMLDHLLQLKGKRINQLMSPGKVNELQKSLKGSFSGIGVVIDKVEGMVFVRDVVPKGPAHKAGMMQRDRILEVEGRSTEEMSVARIVEAIRGKSGTTVKLLVQRGTREWTQEVVRSTVQLDPVASRMLQDRVGYVVIRSFGHKTTERLGQILSELKAKGASSFVLDLRQCPGGLLDVSIQVAGLFLPRNAEVLLVERRAGGKEVHRTKADGPFKDVPMVVLIGPKTASGAEIVAAALADHGRALLVGEPTFGKSTVEKIITLSNGWSVKLSVGRFASPKGHQWHNQGIIPDIAVSGPSASFSALSGNVPAGLEKDAYIKAGLRILELQRRAARPAA